MSIQTESMDRIDISVVTPQCLYEKVRDFINSFDYNKPIIEWTPECLRVVLNIYEYLHNSHLIKFIDKYAIVARLLAAYVHGNNVNLTNNIIENITLFHIEEYYDDVSFIYNMIFAAVKLNNINVISIVSVYANKPTFTICLKMLIFGLSGISLPERTSDDVLEYLYSKYDVYDVNNVRMALKTHLSDKCVKYFFDREVIDVIDVKTMSDNSKMKSIDTTMNELIEECVHINRHCLIVWMIERLSMFIDRCIVDAYVLKNWTMKAKTKNIIHPLYTCDRDTFQYFYHKYGDRIIKDVYFNMFVSPQTFKDIRDLYQFKYYTLFSLYNIAVTSPDEIESLPEDFILYNYINN